VRLVYPENFLVQAASEWGFPATIGLLVLAALALGPVLRQKQVLEPPLIGALAAVVAVVVHELMDFGTELPGVALPATVALGVVAGAAVRRDEGLKRWRPATLAPAMAGWAALVILAMVASAHTLDEDDTTLHDAVVAKHATADALAAAIARHPADDYLELLATDEAMRRRDPSAMHHVNRALLLHPAGWRGHEMAAYLLVSLGRRSQAAIELGLAQKYGLLIDDRRLVSLLGEDVVDSVPQDSSSLLGLADRMLAIGRVAETKKAWARALDRSDAREPVLVAEVRAASRSRDPKLTLPLATALVGQAETAEGFLTAAQALADAGSADKACDVVDAGVKRLRRNPVLLIGGARLKLAAGRPDAAKLLVTGEDERNFTLEQRRDAAELLAAIADRTGDSAGAVIARARAQLLARQIREIRSTIPTSDMK
jgi:hypothetical protein